jgi:hypothetical protein
MRPLRGWASEFGQDECSMLCVKTCARDRFPTLRQSDPAPGVPMTLTPEPPRPESEPLTMGSFNCSGPEHSQGSGRGLSGEEGCRPGRSPA